MAQRILTLGKSEFMGSVVHLEDFSWDCNWYFSGGYLGNQNCHYHVQHYFDQPNVNVFDAIKADFGDSLKLTDNELWKFCDYFKQFYAHQESAGCFRYAGHFSGDMQEECKNKELADAINDHLRNVLIPQVIINCIG